MKRKVGWIFATAFGCFGAYGTVNAAVDFAPQQTFATPAGTYSVTADDLNGNGVLDLATADYNNTPTGANGAAVLLNTTAPNASTASFSAAVGFMTLNNSTSVTTADINDDGKPDLVVTDYGADIVTVLINTTAGGAGTPSFTTHHFPTGPTAAEPIIGATADFNGDGRPDIVVANYGTGTAGVLLNTTPGGSGTPTFATVQPFAAGNGPRSVAVADINNDGRPDIIIANRNSNTVSVFLNTTVALASTPSFAVQLTFATGVNPVSVFAGDVNADGKPDLLVANLNAANISTPSTVSVLLNTTATGSPIPSFAAQKTFTVGVNPQYVIAADIDGDGKPDMVVANHSDNDIGVLLNTTAPNASIPSFAAQATFSTGLFPISIAAADLNGDGMLDLAVANLSSNTVSVLLNTTVSDRIFKNGFEP